MIDTGQVVKYSSLNRRVIAAAIDLFLMILIITPIINPISHLIFEGRGADILLAELSQQAGNDTVVTGSMVLHKFSENDFFQKYFTIQLITLLLMYAYTLGFWLYSGTTPGKWACACKIVDARTFEKLSTLQAIVRLLGYIPSALLFGIGFIMIAFTTNKQGLHDKLAGTVVVNFKHDFKKFEEYRERFLWR